MSLLSLSPRFISLKMGVGGTFISTKNYEKGGPLFDPQLEDATSHLKKAICVILESVEVSESAPFAG